MARGLKRPEPAIFFCVISVAISSEILELKQMLLCGVVKSLVGFPVTLTCLTVNDLEMPFLQQKSVLIICFTTFIGDNYVQRNEDTFILSATKMYARDRRFWRRTVRADIRYGSRVRKCQL